MKWYFGWYLTNWCLEFFGGEFGVGGQCGAATALGTGLDLTPYGKWGKIAASKVKQGCVLPDMGVGPAPAYEPMPPFVPGFNNLEQQERVYAALVKALERAAAAGIKHVIVFTGMDTGEERGVQFQRIVDCFTKPRGSAQKSLIEMAEELGIVFLIEMLNILGNPETWEGHKGYLGSSTKELVEKVVRPIGSKCFLLAFDIYHIVMMGEDLFALIDEYHNLIGYVHVAQVVLKAGGGYETTNRGELTLAGEIDIAAVGEKLARHLPIGTPVLIEYIPHSNNPAQVQADLLASMQLFESKIAA